MRVLHICQRDDPDTGGSLRVAEALVREQRKRGVDAWLLFLYGEPSAVSKALARNTIALGLKSSREAYFGVWNLIKMIRTISPDIIHSHDGIIWPRLAFLVSGIPVVMHTHLPSGQTSRLKDEVGRVLVKASTRLLIGISLPTIESWVNEKFPPSRIHYIPNGVDFSRFPILSAAEKCSLRRRLHLPENRRVLLWVGRIHREMKGADRVEQVIGKLPEDMALVVVGNGPDFNGMEEYCASWIENGRMFMIGSTTKPELYYQAADMFLFTSYYEPFGLVLLEAVASGLPIVAYPVTRGGGAVKLLEEFDATMLADSDLTSDVQAKVNRAFDRKQLSLDLQKQIKLKYSWERVSARVVDAYNIVLNKIR